MLSIVYSWFFCQGLLPRISNSFFHLDRLSSSATVSKFSLFRDISCFHPKPIATKISGNKKKICFFLSSEKEKKIVRMERRRRRENMFLTFPASGQNMAKSCLRNDDEKTKANQLRLLPSETTSITKSSVGWEYLEKASYSNLGYIYTIQLIRCTIHPNILYERIERQDDHTSNI